MDGWGKWGLNVSCEINKRTAISMRTNPRKYKYWVKFIRQAPGKKNEQDITWEKLVDVICERRPHLIKAVNFYHPDAPFGTGHVDGITMLALWKAVEARKAAKLAT
jgi:hypothetical protein